MTRIVLLIALSSCVKGRDSDKVAHDAVGSGAKCLREYGKHVDVTFCVVGSSLTICNREGCITTQAEAPR